MVTEWATQRRRSEKLGCGSNAYHPPHARATLWERETSLSGKAMTACIRQAGKKPKVLPLRDWFRFVPVHKQADSWSHTSVRNTK